MTRNLDPIAAYDIWPDGRVTEVTEPWPSATPSEGAGWRWLHCDRTSGAFANWAVANLPAPVRASLLQAETRPRCDAVGDGLLLTLRAINLNPGAEGEDMVALRLWVTGRLIVTTRLRRLYVIEEMRADLAEGRAPLSPGAFVARLADQMTARIEEVSLDREDATDAIEEVLLDDEPDALGTGEQEISRIARSVIKLRRHVAPQREALSRLATIDVAFLGPAERYELREVANRTQRTVEELDTTRDRLASLRAHIDSLHAWRMGRQSFVLSVAAAVFLPLGFLTGLFGVNLGGMPGEHSPYAFAVLTIGSGIIGFALWLWFRWLRWF
ncbi:zinc transporter ZntB [Ostreiculturibacter nitratireducens]|uniref:zinc transporter ZntB n=1 Tax=Ostreiculturibacter nitratireducens TaxID=3075226 RepID=UPI0031B5B69B